MRKYLLIAAMGLAACGSDKNTSKGTVNNGNNTVGTNTGTGGGDNNNPNPTDNSTLTGPTVAQMGRIHFNSATNGNEMAWAGSRITAGVTGTNSISIGLKTSSPFNLGSVYFSVMIDGTTPADPAIIKLDNTQAVTSFTVNLPDTGHHYVQWTKISEPAYGLAVFTGVTPGAGGQLAGTPVLSQRHIEFIGDSIVNGYGVMGRDPCNGNSTNSNADLSFASLTAKALGADYTLIAYSGRGLETNLNGTATTTQNNNDPANANNVMPAMFLNTIPPSSSSLNPIMWDPNLLQPQVVVINLGTNDFSRATNAFVAAGNSTSACTTTSCNPDQANFTGAYTSFLTTVRAAYPNAYIIATTGPMLSNSYPSNAQQHDTSKAWITAAITAKNDPKMSFYDFGVQDTTVTGCNSHPSDSQQLAMAQGGTDALSQVHIGLVSYIKQTAGW